MFIKRVKNSSIFIILWNTEKMGNREAGSGLTYPYVAVWGSGWYPWKAVTKEECSFKKTRQQDKQSKLQQWGWIAGNSDIWGNDKQLTWCREITERAMHSVQLPKNPLTPHVLEQHLSRAAKAQVSLHQHPPRGETVVECCQLWSRDTFNLDFVLTLLSFFE